MGLRALRAGAAERDAAPLRPITAPEMFTRVHRLPSGTKVFRSFVLVSQCKFTQCRDRFPVI